MGFKQTSTLAITTFLAGAALVGCSGGDSKVATAQNDNGAAIFGLTAKTKGLTFTAAKLPAKLVQLDSDTGLVLSVTPPHRASYFITFKKGDSTAENASLSEVGDYSIDVVNLDVQSCRLKLVYER